MRVYLSGPMDRCPQGGKKWREQITPKLQNFGLVVVDPCNKPINLDSELIENRDYRANLLETKQYGKFAKEIKTLRVIDLRCVDIVDFLIVNFDVSQQMCGTLEEIFLANRQKKPVLLYCPQGIKKIYHWMWGVLPYQHFFEAWDSLFDYISDVNVGKNTEHFKRWIWFDYDKLQNKK